MCLLDIVEIYIPVTTFFIMFSIFIISIFFRYILNNPIIWSNEVTISAYIYAALLGAAYTRREHGHVTFSIIYDKRSLKGKIVFRLLANIITALVFSIAIYSFFDYVKFIQIKKSPFFKVPFSLIYAPFVVGIALIIGHSFYDFIVDIKNLRKINKSDKSRKAI